MSVSRRKFVELGLLSSAGAAAGCGGLRLAGPPLGAFMEATSTDERVSAGVERWVNTACTLCPGGCGVRVRMIDGRAVKLEGNPSHPLSRGGLCPAGQAALQLLYNPDRVRGPLRRVGERGSGRWEQIGWEQAIQIVADRLGALRARGEAHTLAVVAGRAHGVMADLLARFARAFGTPNVLFAVLDDPAAHAVGLAQGVHAPPAYDLENARYVLSFGVPLVDGWWAPVRQMRALVQIRQGTPGHRGKLVQVEPRLSRTAAKADEWIPLGPGTEGVLALGLACVLVEEALFDRAFVDEWTSGFEDRTGGGDALGRGFGALVLQQYRPDVVAARTGVPEATIRRLARELAGAGSAVAIGPPAGSPGAADAARAVLALNALLGSIERPGGVLLPRAAPYADWPDFGLDTVARRGRAMPRLDGGGTTTRPPSNLSALAGAVRSGQPYSIQALLVWAANPAFTEPDPAGWQRALARIPFVVSFASFLDETAQLADLVLPDHVFLEAWTDVPPPPGIAYPVVSVAPPVVKPSLDSRHTGDVILALARALGGPVEQAMPWREFRDALAARLRGLYDSGTGMVFTRHERPTPPGPLREWEWAPLPYRSFEEFWNDLVQEGGWVDPSYRYEDWKRAFRTPSGKFQFAGLAPAPSAPGAPAHGGVAPATAPAVTSLRADAQGSTPRALVSDGAAPAVLRRSLPEATSSDTVVGGAHGSLRPAARTSGDGDALPLELHLFPLLALGNGELANLPFLQEALYPYPGAQWGTWVEVNPETADRLGVADGEPVRIESPAGSVRATVRRFAGIVPGVVAMPTGQGHTALGRYAQGVGSNPMTLVDPAARDPATGAPARATRVRIARSAEGGGEGQRG